MKLQKPTIEQSLYLLALALASWLRLLYLGREALSDPEAALALQSLGLARGSATLIGPQPGYVLPTALLDFIFGATNFSARLWPAVCGLLLLLVVYLLRERLGRIAALALAFGIALDPGLTAVARQVGAQGVGLVFVLLALACWVRRKSVWAGIWAGLAILGGPQIWPNLLALGLAGWLVRKQFREDWQSAGDFDWRLAGVSFLASAVLLGTLLLLAPGGLSGAAASLPAYFGGWTISSGVSALRLLGALLGYEFMGLVLAFSGALSGALLERNREDLFLFAWWAISLLFVLVYPARQVFDLAWPLVPMLALAARQVPRMLKVDAQDRLATIGQALLVLLLLLLDANLAISWPTVESQSGTQVYRLMVLSISIVLLVSETILVAWGWSRKIALYGLAWGISGLMFLGSVAGLGNVTGISARDPAELWRSGPAFAQADLFLQTVKNQSMWMPDPTQAPEILVSGLSSPAVEWILRDFPGLQVSNSLPADANPGLLVTADRSELGLGIRYTGQAFTLSEAPAWDLVSPSEWLKWLVYRSIKKEAWNTTNLILWVRSDQFPGAAPLTTSNVP